VEKSELSKTIKMGDLETNLSKTFKENKEFHDSYDKFKGGMEMISSMIGSVAASNIATPFIRNAWGAKQQKTSIEKDRYNQNMNPTATPMPVNTLQIKTGTTNFRGTMQI
jgi:hypothetical protein